MKVFVRKLLLILSLLTLRIHQRPLRSLLIQQRLIFLANPGESASGRILFDYQKIAN